MAQARFDKEGRRLPDTGHGCGCRMCAEANAPRYERRLGADRGDGGQWSPVRRGLVRLVRSFKIRRRPELA
jgi:hypothetical protein